MLHFVPTPAGTSPRWSAIRSLTRALQPGGMAAACGWLWLVVVVSAVQAAPVIHVTTIGTGIKPNAVNNSGVVVGQGSDDIAFKWRYNNKSYTALGTLGGLASEAYDINNNGVIVGWSDQAIGNKSAFRWSQNTFEPLTVGSQPTYAVSINDVDRIVGWTTFDDFYVTTRWGTLDNIGGVLFTNSGPTTATGINNGGEIVGLGYSGSLAFDGYYYDGFSGTSEYTTGLPLYRPFGGINNHSVSIGQFGAVATIIDFGDPTMLSTPITAAGLNSVATGINDYGFIVGTTADSVFLYDYYGGIYYDLNDFGLTGDQIERLLWVSDINDRNQVTGIALVNGVEVGVLLNLRGVNGPIVPEPSTLLLAASALLVCCLTRRGQRKR